LIGDAGGADKEVQRFLQQEGYREVLVFCSGHSCRNNLGNWETNFVAVESAMKGRAFYTQKDLEMAEYAAYGFMIWDGKSPGTLMNIVELLRRGKKTVVYLALDRCFHNVATVEQLGLLLRKCHPEDVATINKKLELPKLLNKMAAPAQQRLDY
jgi:hypothetical protein